MKKVEDRYIYNKQNNSKITTTTTMIIPHIVENGSHCAERARPLSFLLFLVTAAGIVRVVEVKFARAQGVHDDVEDTKLTGS
jgi:hypothetical protein